MVPLMKGKKNMNFHRIFLEEYTRNCSHYYWEGKHIFSLFFIVHLLKQLENVLVTKGLVRWREERHLRSEINTQKS